MTMKNKAFTLIETIIAITLTTLVLTAVTGLILTTLLANQRNLHSLQAMYLAQESLEALRFMRDSNWLQNYAWNGGARLWGSDFDISDEMEMELFLAEEDCPPCFAFTSSEMEGTVITENGVEYLRSLQFKPLYDENGEILTGAMEAIAIVSWQERGLTRTTSLSTYLSNWQ